MTRKEYEQVLDDFDLWNEKTLNVICLNRRVSEEEERVSVNGHFRKTEAARKKARSLYDLSYCTNEDFQRLLRAERMFELIQEVEKTLKEKEEVIRSMELEYERDDVIFNA